MGIKGSIYWNFNWLAYLLILTNDRLEVSTEMWTESHVAAVVRSFAMECSDSAIFPMGNLSKYSAISDGIYQNIIMQLGVKTLNPFQYPGTEYKFFNSLEQVFAECVLVGCDKENVRPNALNNHITKIVYEYFLKSSNFEEGFKFFSRFKNSFPQVSAFLARFLIEMDREVEAVKLLFEIQKEIPLKYPELTLVQGDFMREKNKPQTAVQLYLHSVELSPADPDCWLALCEAYIETGDTDSALKCLNNCPVSFTARNTAAYSDKHMGGVISNLIDQSHAFPIPAKRYLPANELSEIMEDIQKICQELEIPIEDIANNPLYYITGVSKTKDSCDVSLYKLQAQYLKNHTLQQAYLILSKICSKTGWDSLLEHRSKVFVMEEEYKLARGSSTDISEDNANQELENSQPDNKRIDEQKKLSDESSSPPKFSDRNSRISQKKSKDAVHGSSKLTISMFDQKRLCERWLDHLFMILYDDLRLYVLFKAEVEQSRVESLTYSRTPTEWELLGDLCSRLHKSEESVFCFESYVETRYNFRVWHKLLSIYLQDLSKYGEKVLKACNKMLSTIDRWNNEAIRHPMCSIRRAIRALQKYYGDKNLRMIINHEKIGERNQTLIINLMDECLE